MAAVHDEKGKAVMESLLKTEAEALRDFVKRLSGHLQRSPRLVTDKCGHGSASARVD
jgi:hypothetical protein